jgi:hypothetical protein
MEDFDGFFTAMEAKEKVERWKRRKDFLCMVHKPGNGFKRPLTVVKQRLEQQSIPTDKQTSSISILAVLVLVSFAGLTTAISSAVPVILSTSKEYSQKQSSPQYINTNELCKSLSMCGFEFLLRSAVSIPVVLESNQQCFKVSSTLFMLDRTGVAVKIFDPGGCQVITSLPSITSPTPPQ